MLTLQTRCQVAHLAESIYLRVLGGWEGGTSNSSQAGDNCIPPEPSPLTHSWMMLGWEQGQSPGGAVLLLPSRLRAEIKSSTKKRPGKWRGHTLSYRSDLERAIGGESHSLGKGGNHQPQERGQPSSASAGSSWGGGEKGTEDPFLQRGGQAGPRDGHWGNLAYKCCMESCRDRDWCHFKK